MAPLNVPVRAALRAAVEAQKGKPALGLWSTLPGTALVRTVAATTGISWVLIDAEHGQLNDTNIYEHANAIMSQGCSPIVRVPIGEAWWIKRAYDSGAHGIMAPLAHDVQTVRDIVSSSKYPPVGTRGFGPMYTHHAFGATPLEYKTHANEQLLVIVQIESKQGFANVDEIAQVEGLDALFIGPFDLSLSLGCEFGSDAHEEAIALILAAAHKHGKIAAIYCTNGEQAAKRSAQGFDMISVATDVDFISQACAQHVAAALGRTAGQVGGAYS